MQFSSVCWKIHAVLMVVKNVFSFTKPNCCLLGICKNLRNLRTIFNFISYLAVSQTKFSLGCWWSWSYVWVMYDERDAWNTNGERNIAFTEGWWNETRYIQKSKELGFIINAFLIHIDVNNHYIHDDARARLAHLLRRRYIQTCIHTDIDIQICFRYNLQHEVTGEKTSQII